MIDLLILEKAINTIKVIVTMSIFINLFLLFVYIVKGNKNVAQL